MGCGRRWPTCGPTTCRREALMPEPRTALVRANGLAFAIDEAGEGDSVALLLHGFPESRWCWRHQIPMLASSGWRAVAPDMRGYGGSSRPTGRRAYRIERLVEDVAGLFDALGARRRLLIAHDWGGLVAWAFAIQERLPLEGFVVMNMPHPAAIARARTSLRQWLRSWYVLWLQLPWLPERVMTAGRADAVVRIIRGTAVHKDRFPDEVLEPYRRNALLPGAMTAMIDYYRANLRAMYLQSWSAPAVTVPTLMLWGEQDVAIGVEFCEGHGDLVADLTLHRFPDASHWVHEEAPDEVNARIGAWMRARHLV
jgi:pimeloyl-ACP methyl ester carboxylesterase